MSDEHLESFVVRPRFLLACLRWAVINQVVITVALGLFLTMMAVMRGIGFTPNDLSYACGVFGTGAVFALLFATRHWVFDGARLTATGIKQAGTFIPWERVSAVRRGHSWLRGKTLRIESELRGVFITLPQRSADFDRCRDAVERLAGPDHPLALALAEVVDG